MTQAQEMKKKVTQNLENPYKYTMSKITKCNEMSEII